MKLGWKSHSLRRRAAGRAESSAKPKSPEQTSNLDFGFTDESTRVFADSTPESSHLQYLHDDVSVSQGFGKPFLIFAHRSALSIPDANPFRSAPSSPASLGNRPPLSPAAPS